MPPGKRRGQSCEYQRDRRRRRRAIEIDQNFSARVTVLIRISVVLSTVHTICVHLSSGNVYELMPKYMGTINQAQHKRSSGVEQSSRMAFGTRAYRFRVKNRSRTCTLLSTALAIGSAEKRKRKHLARYVPAEILT